MHRQENKRVIAIILSIFTICLVAIIVILAATRRGSGRDRNRTVDLKNIDPSNYVQNLNANEVIANNNVSLAIQKSYSSTLDDADSLIPDHANQPVHNVTGTTVILYIDPSASHCRALSPYFAAIEDKYGTYVTFIYRSFSLGYQNSDITIRATEAASKLGGYTAYKQMVQAIAADDIWLGTATMKDTSSGPVYFNDSRPVPYDQAKEKLRTYANNIGIDPDKFIKVFEDYENNGIQEKLERDKALATKQNVMGVPTVLVNGETVRELTQENIETDIQNALSSN